MPPCFSHGSVSLRLVASEGLGVAFVDHIELSGEYFSLDGGHLERSEARAYSRRLAGEIQRLDLGL